MVPYNIILEFSLWNSCLGSIKCHIKLTTVGLISSKEFFNESPLNKYCCLDDTAVLKRLPRSANSKMLGSMSADYTLQVLSSFHISNSTSVNVLRKATNGKEKVRSG